MGKHYKIWTNDEDSSRVKAFKSALVFRKSEIWQFTHARDDADLWIVDVGYNFQEDDYDFIVIKNTYQTTHSKPKVAIIGSNINKEIYDFPERWRIFNWPVSVDIIFRWLDESFYDFRSGSQLQNDDRDLNNADYSAEPWKDKPFKLLGWPNISQFDSKIHIAITCSNLLNNYHDFKSAQQWGTSAEILNKLLSNAYQNSLLKIDDAHSKQKNISQDNKKENKKGLSLLQKLINRFR